MKIEYKDIPGYEGIYQATSNGEIYALPRTWVTYRKGVQGHNGYFVSKVNLKGYLYTKLTNSKSKRKTWLVHRLIALAYIENIENKKEVNHINGVKSDNRVENLEWCTHQENCKHREDMGLGSTKKANDWWKKKVLNIENNVEYESIVEAAKSIGMGRKHLSMMLNGVRKNKTTMLFV